MTIYHPLLAEWLFRGIALSVAAVAVYGLLRPGGKGRATLLAVTTAGLLLLPLALLAGPKWTLGWIVIPEGSAVVAGEVLEKSGEGKGWVLLWGLGVALCFVRMGRGLGALRKIEDGSAIADGEVRRCAHWAAQKLGMREPVVLLSKGCRGPFATGLMRVRIVLPGEASTWSTAVLRPVLLHEMAHIRRGDLWMQAAGNVVCALYWFNPLVWFLHRRLAQEREFLADVLVVAIGTDARRYARALLDVAVAASPRGGASGASVAIGLTGASRLEDRIRRLLNGGARGKSGRAAGAMLVGVLAVAGAACLDPFAPAPPPGDEEGAFVAEEAIWTESEVGRRLSASPFPGD